jgi:hypothetical protein
VVGNAGLTVVKGEIDGDEPPLGPEIAFVCKPKMLGCLRSPGVVAEAPALAVFKP